MMDDNNQEDWDRVLEYIRACPSHVAAPTHPAIQAAIQGVEQERKRRARDAKLMQKFTAATTTTTATESSNSTNLETRASFSYSSAVNKRSSSESSSTTAATENNNNNNTSATLPSTKMRKNDDGESGDNNNEGDDEAMSDDWHAVEPVPSDMGDETFANNKNPNPAVHDSSNNVNNNHNTCAAATASGTCTNSSSYLGEVLSQEAIRSVAQHNVQVKSPVAALAAVMHASLVSQYLDFVCTGIPMDATSSGGFAPPIRPLVNVFLPDKWDDNFNAVALRYRKDGLGSIVLTVAATPPLTSTTTNTSNNKNKSLETTTVQVTWNQTQSSGSAKPEPLATFSFPLDDHVNLQSWNRASQMSTIPINPCLHFKSLAALLSQWARTLDLGDDSSRHNNNNNNASLTFMAVDDNQRGKILFDPTPQPVLPQQSQMPYGGCIPTRLPTAPFPLRGGPHDPRWDGEIPGPNHPVFTGDPRRPGGGFGDNGGFLQPRFDPHGPPPTQPQPDDGSDPRRFLGGGGGGGRPNHDHFRPPNNLNNNNMFL
ncbi:hypothetical protein ACA910_011765 [Epithemia clementina (nom. ined.)]